MHLSSNGVDLTPAQQAMVAAAVANLERFFGRLVATHVAVSVPNRRMGGDPIEWTFRLVLTVPGRVLTVTRQAKPSFGEALEDAFDVARRQLQDYAREIRGEVKSRAEELHGRISRLLAHEGFGFITADDGHELYFHRNSVPDAGFDRLGVGTEVRFVEVEGDQGPQASTVVAVKPSLSALPGERGGGTWQ
jgi:cold shock CspA family protein/ribosome-associated translation inhibitor RaiA